MHKTLLLLVLGIFISGCTETWPCDVIGIFYGEPYTEDDFEKRKMWSGPDQIHEKESSRIGLLRSVIREKARDYYREKFSIEIDPEEVEEWIGFHNRYLEIDDEGLQYFADELKFQYEMVYIGITEGKQALVDKYEFDTLHEYTQYMILSMIERMNKEDVQQKIDSLGENRDQLELSLFRYPAERSVLIGHIVRHFKGDDYLPPVTSVEQWRKNGIVVAQAFDKILLNDIRERQHIVLRDPKLEKKIIEKLER